MIAHGASIIELKIGRLKKANEALSKRKTQKRKVIKGSISRSVSKSLQSASQGGNQQVIKRNEVAPTRRQRRYGRCREPGHRVKTCPQPQLVSPDIIDPALLTS